MRFIFSLSSEASAKNDQNEWNVDPFCCISFLHINQKSLFDCNGLILFFNVRARLRAATGPSTKLWHYHQTWF